jgi:hypothetical protein
MPPHNRMANSSRSLTMLLGKRSVSLMKLPQASPKTLPQKSLRFERAPEKLNKEGREQVKAVRRQYQDTLSGPQKKAG